MTRHLHTVELSKRWSLSPRTLECWRSVGQGPHFLKLGGRVVYRLEDVEFFERQHMHLIQHARHHGTFAKPRAVSSSHRVSA